VIFKTGRALVFTGCLLLSACLRSPEGATPFVAPTNARTVEPGVTPTLENQPPTLVPTVIPTPPCVNKLKFLEDVTIPDGTTVRPGESLDKRWRVQNNGTCSWDESYRLELSSGSEMGAAKEQALYPARGSSEAVLRMVFIAPADSGNYHSAWQAMDPYGEPFGDQFYIDIAVAP
jgi:hypothetical protein